MADWFEKLEIDPPGGGRKPQMPEIDFRKIVPVVIGILLAVLFIAFRPWYTVEPGEVGVVLRLGEYHRTTGPGLNFRLPYPLEEVYTPNILALRRIEVGFRSGASGGSSRGVPEESQMITGDENIIDSQMIVQYKIDPERPQDYLFNVSNPEDTLKDIVEAAERQVIGDSAIDAALTDGRNEIQDEIEVIIQEVCDKYRMGIQIIDARLHTTQAPAPVEPAFVDVFDAREDQVRFVNQAEAYRNSEIPKAEAQVQKILQEAEAYRAQRIARAKGEVERFSSILREYQNATEVTRTRLYLETLEKVLAGKPKVILESGSEEGVLKFLNVNPSAGGFLTVPKSAADEEGAR